MFALFALANFLAHARTTLSMYIYRAFSPSPTLLFSLALFAYWLRYVKFSTFRTTSANHFTDQV
jgi:hypothetical protein